MKLNLQRFYKACNPAKTLTLRDEDDWNYYIDFSNVRGSNVIDGLERTITRLASDEPTCQLFTGHIGCGKSTELRKLESRLQHSHNFHVVYFESHKDLEMADVDITDILLAIARQISESLEAVGIRLLPNYFVKLFNEIADFLQTPIELSQVKFSLPGAIAEITAKTKDSPNLRSQLRQFLEPRTNSILQSINQEVIQIAIDKLKIKGKKGLVVIVDDLDRVDNRAKTNARSQPEYLFIDRGEQLRELNCHKVYTIPLSLIFSNESETLKNRLGGGVTPKVLPMVPVQLRHGDRCENGMALLRQMVLARAFPEVKPEQRLELITEVFDDPETLDRLCEISGGHVRNLLGLLYRCIQVEDPPLSRECLEDAIRDSRDSLASAIKEDEWNLLRKVLQLQSVEGGEVAYQTLLRSLFVFEYQDKQGRWFGINPVLAETNKFKL